MSHLLKVLLLTTTFCSTIHTDQVNDSSNTQGASKVSQIISQLLKKSDPPLNLLLVAGFLRLFAPYYFLAEMKKMICDYAGAVDYYPYIQVSSTPDSMSTIKIAHKMSSLIYFLENSYATIYEEKLMITIMNSPKAKETKMIMPSHFLLNNPKDQLYCLFPLKDYSPNFSFLALTKAGSINYISGNREGRLRFPGLIPHFSNLGVKKIWKKISFCQGKQPLTFLVLSNTPSPTLFFYRVVEHNHEERALQFMKLNTSSWHKSSENSLQNLLFLGNQHFIILNHHPELGNRLFLYNLDAKKPIGYISLNKEYRLLNRFSHDTLALLSLASSSMMLFSHTTQSFVDFPLSSNLLPVMILPNTRQAIMTYLPNSKEEKVLKNFKKGRFLLCNLENSFPPSIQYVFEVIEQRESTEVLTVDHYALTDVLLQKPQGATQKTYLGKTAKSGQEVEAKLARNILSFGVRRVSVNHIETCVFYGERVFTLVRKKRGIKL